MKYKVLIIEDHPLTALAYKNAFEAVSKTENSSFYIDEARTCDEALEFITKAAGFKPYDLVFLDINLPVSTTSSVRSGDDLGEIINEKFPEAKILVSTTFYDNYRIKSIISNINPDAFMVKNDLAPEILIDAIKTVIHNPPFYSTTALQSFRQYMANELVLDKTDIQLLFELSIGTRMKDLPKILLLSTAGVEKRKRRLKDGFGIAGEDDRTLVLTAKEKGFL